jgi:hypothetical protein
MIPVLGVKTKTRCVPGSPAVLKSRLTSRGHCRDPWQPNPLLAKYTLYLYRRNDALLLKEGVIALRCGFFVKEKIFQKRG